MEGRHAQGAKLSPALAFSMSSSVEQTCCFSAISMSDTGRSMMLLPTCWPPPRPPLFYQQGDDTVLYLPHASQPTWSAGEHNLNLRAWRKCQQAVHNLEDRSVPSDRTAPYILWPHNQTLKQNTPPAVFLISVIRQRSSSTTPATLPLAALDDR